MHESEKWKGSRSVVSDPQWSHGLQLSRLLHPWDFPGKSTGVGCHCLLWSKCNYCFKWAKVLFFIWSWPRLLDIFNEPRFDSKQTRESELFYMIQHDSTCIYSLHLKICKYKNEFACRQLRPPPRPQSPKWRHGKEPPAYVRGVGSIPESGRTPGVGQGNALQYSCLENPHRQRSLEACSPWGRKRVRHDVVT